MYRKQLMWDWVSHFTRKTETIKSGERELSNWTQWHHLVQIQMPENRVTKGITSSSSPKHGNQGAAVYFWHKSHCLTFVWCPGAGHGSTISDKRIHPFSDFFVVSVLALKQWDVVFPHWWPWIFSLVYSLIFPRSILPPPPPIMCYQLPGHFCAESR